MCAPLKHLHPIMGSASVWHGSVHGSTISRHQQSVHYVRHSNTYNPSWAQPVYGVAASMELQFQDTNNLYIMCATQTLTTHHGLSQCTAWRHPWNYYFKTPTICTLCAPLKHLRPIMGSASVRRGSIRARQIKNMELLSQNIDT